MTTATHTDATSIPPLDPPAPNASKSPALGDQVVQVLHELAIRAKGGWGVRELAARLGASRSTINRVLLGLAAVDLAHRDAYGNYSTGPRFRVLTNRLHATHPLLSNASPILADLAAACDATAVLTLYDGHRQCFIAAVAVAPRPLRFDFTPGMLLPLHAGAAGRAILSRLGVGALGRELTAFTPQTPTSPTRLQELAASDRVTGQTISMGEDFPMAAALAVPFDLDGLIGSVAIIRSQQDTPTDHLERLAPHVRDACRRLSNAPAQASPTGAPAPQQPPWREETGQAAPRPETAAPAVARFGRLLAVLAASPAPTGAEATGRGLARRISASTATALKLRNAAVEAGLALVSNDRLLAGPRLVRWAALTGATPDRSALVHDILRALSERTGETIGIVEFDKLSRSARLAAVVPGSRPLQYDLPTGTRIPLHAGAAGKAILAYLPADFISKAELTRFTPTTLTRAEALHEDLQAVRARGWATGEGERIPGAYGISAPYFIDGAVAGSLNATIPQYRAAEIDIDDIAEHIRLAAHKITQRLSLHPTVA
ncbi:IclR family transcriptional regulator [Paenarthrobacter nicotinovorans]|uniref:IclR family transcriptional regulator n=1 Tax=Paenarthrobacter nicotinovorans TaxID=29320 RepID=UPI00382429B9